ncbi:efflux RND transporter periplasmic adaptor subunit [Sedimentitalea todarodis]|uniref:Efflux RND transporter periplasmic adaptor subunit n=1 Tax=Sedimentitalea todarodis TaxID=1631240 RepID=A0ABU3VBQ3_9RHOB|nr:efflux RND transporter periplasmic adaptor subunit [Sedimentitalea todarodis]MDU9003606.1 efflux RND transporter periplasmic adaptor subunit [Sedimentitalea todarodis]
MRLIPVLTAILVTLGLYAVVFEREALFAFARGDESTEDATEAPAGEGYALASEAPDAVGVVVLRSTAEQIDSRVILRGQTGADRQVEVRAETSATVVSPPLRKGTFVKTTDVLCQLDVGTREAALAEARARLTEARAREPETEARLAEAEARLSEALINNNAAEKLSKGGYASETRLASTQAAVRSAEAGLASAKSGLETTQAGIQGAAAAVAAAEREIERLTIRAPFDGLLESDTAELGSLMQPGGLCATVIRLDPIKLVGYVPESDVNRINLGAMAGAELTDGRRVQGTVDFISRSADPTTRTFLVEITVPNPDMSIRDGQTAAIAIAADGTMAHRLPASALTLNNDGQLGVRIVLPDNIVDFRPIRLLRDDVDGIWVTGLDEETDVIVVGQEFVTKGVLVKPAYREAAQ